MREYFFNATILSTEWFRRHIELAAKSSEPRYSPKLKIDTPLLRWLEAFGGDASWQGEFLRELSGIEDALRIFHANFREAPLNEAFQTDISKTTELCRSSLSQGKAALLAPTEPKRSELRGIIDSALEIQRRLRLQFSSVPEGEPSGQRWRSPLMGPLASMSKWLASPSGGLGFCRTFILTGEGGSGKTHGICDMALRRLDHGACSCVVFGHDFDGQASEWVGLGATAKSCKNQALTIIPGNPGFP